MKKVKSQPTVDPTDVINGIFSARRDLVHTINWVIQGSGLSVEEADLLISLYGARVFDWDDIEHDKNGYVTFTEVENFLVHNRSMVSRRIIKLSSMKPPLLETAKADPSSGLHFNSKVVRITEAGIKRAEPIWERYRHVSATMVEGISQEQLRIHVEVNEEISARIRQYRGGVGQFLAAKLHSK